LDLAMSGVAARFEDVSLKGDVHIFARAARGSPADLRFDISGTRNRDPQRRPSWTGSIRLRCRR